MTAYYFCGVFAYSQGVLNRYDAIFFKGIDDENPYVSAMKYWETQGGGCVSGMTVTITPL